MSFSLPHCKHVEGSGGDEGIDIFAGELNQKLRTQTGSTLRMWQVKFFRGGVKSNQREKAEKSLNRVIKTYQPDYWTLCIPVNLDVRGHQWINSLKDRHPGLTIDVWQADEIIRRMHHNGSLIDSYFLRPQPAVPENKLKEILHHIEDFENVPDLLERAAMIPKDASNFYNGAIPKCSKQMERIRKTFPDISSNQT